MALVAAASMQARGAGQDSNPAAEPALAWLQYNPPAQRPRVPTQVRALGTGAVELSAKSELERGLFGMMGRIVFARIASPYAIVLGTDAEMAKMRATGAAARRGWVAIHNDVKRSPEWRAASDWAPLKFCD